MARPIAIGRRLRHGQRQWRWAVVLIAPAVVLLMASVVVPLSLILVQSVTNQGAPAVFPGTASALAGWSGRGLPEPDVAEVFARELVAAQEARQLPRAASQLDADMDGFRAKLVRTARGLDGRPSGATPVTVETLAAIDEYWAREGTWRALQRGLSPVTATHLLRALDFEYDREGALVWRPATERIFVGAMVRTVTISVAVTAFCVILAVPIALVMVHGGPTLRMLALAAVLLPFWTSLLVRTSAWIVLLQRQGLLNEALITLGITAERIQLIHNRSGLVVAMTHILLPFVVLPLYAALRSLPVQQVQAALSLGATPLQGFRDVVLPQVFPGLQTGIILAFTIALGFYVTPALVGGPADQMISSFIASSINERLDWATASALSALLMGLLLTVFAIALVVRARAVGR